MAVLVLLTFRAGARAAADRAAVYRDEIRPLLAEYCFDCHDDDTQKGGVNLGGDRDLAALYRRPQVWENALRQIEERSMPPREKKKQPAPAEYHRLIDWLRETLDNPDPAWVPVNPGAKLIHRLNRTEYNLTIRDLLGVDTRPADQFPPDGGGGGGFDNNADTLFVPPVLMERYLLAAEEVLAKADRRRWLLEEPVWYTPDRVTARNNLRWFLRRAFRRPVGREEVESYLGLYQSLRRQGRSFEVALQSAYKAALVSPHFLFRVELDQAGPGPHRISSFELASRLSYFLWSSMPDDALLEAAERGELDTDDGLERQVGRMLADPRSRALSENFVGQWLETRNLAATASPDPHKYPRYTPTLREAMVAEPVAFFHGLVSSKGSLLELLDSTYTYANAELAALYGLEGIQGERLVRVSLPDRRRGGVTGMAAVLTKTSYPRRTSPVLRGKWILEEVLGTPPPPPPPIVATLPTDDRVRDGLTLRQRLEEHRKNPNCAACHSRLDPMGFALENFDGIGAWRTKIDGQPVDASGVLPSGETVNGPEALKASLLARKDLFLRHLTEKMLAYALGRGLEYYDVPTVKQIGQRLAAQDFRATALIVEIVRSRPFQQRRGADAVAGQP